MVQTVGQDLSSASGRLDELTISAGETLDAADTRIRAEQLALPDANAMEITEAVRDDFAARLGDIETVWIDGNPGRQATYDGVLQILNEIRAG